MPDINPPIPENAVSLFGQNDTSEEFPILKAFQQYVNDEQNKARKRMVMLSAVFAAVLILVIAMFAFILVGISQRNQTLNDRLVEYAMSDRNRQIEDSGKKTEADNATILALTSKLEALQKALFENQLKVARAGSVPASKPVSESPAVQPSAPQGPSAAELEVQKLKLQLAAERERLALEKEKARQREREEFLRKQYPDAYAPKKQVATKLSPSPKKKQLATEEIDDEVEDALEAIEELEDDKAINYFDDKEDEIAPVKKPVKRSPAKKTLDKKSPTKKISSIPVKIQGSSSSWQIPNE